MLRSSGEDTERRSYAAEIPTRTRRSSSRTWATIIRLEFLSGDLTPLRCEQGHTEVPRDLCFNPQTKIQKGARMPLKHQQGHAEIEQNLYYNLQAKMLNGDCTSLRCEQAHIEVARNLCYDLQAQI